MAAATPKIPPKAHARGGKTHTVATFLVQTFGRL